MGPTKPASKIFGEYGDPWDAAFGLTYFPYGRKEVRMNVQALYMDRSAVGYTAVPYVVGGTGWVYTVAHLVLRQNTCTVYCPADHVIVVHCSVVARAC